MVPPGGVRVYLTISNHGFGFDASTRCGGPMPVVGQTRRFDPPPVTSGLPRTTDIIAPDWLVRLGPQAVISQQVA